MEDSQVQYLRLNKFLLSAIGQWPYNNSLQRIIIMIIFTPLTMGQPILQGGGVVAAWYNSDMEAAMEGFTAFTTSLMGICKYTNAIVNHSKIKELLFMMEDDWRVFSKFSDEHNILCQKYETARKITISYAVLLYGTIAPFFLNPSGLIIADAMGFYNYSSERTTSFRIEYFVDVNKYYYALLFHGYIATLGLVSLTIAFDTLMILYVQHDSGISDILGYRLQRISETDNLDIELHVEKRNDKSYEIVKNCAILHKKIIQYAEKMDSVNTTFSMLQLLLTMLGISFALFQAVMNLKNPVDFTRYILFFCCLLCIVFIQSWPGQQLTDHTERIFEHTTSGKWYQTSLSTRKLLYVMMLRSFKPIKLTAGRYFTLNLQNFSAVVRTSFSYFTLLTSMQE